MTIPSRPERPVPPQVTPDEPVTPVTPVTPIVIPPEGAPLPGGAAVPASNDVDTVDPLTETLTEMGLEIAPLPLALVTGAGRRLGRAVALELARQGFAIGLHYHQSAAEAEAVADEIGSLVPVFRLQADLTDPAQIEDLFAQAAALPHPLRVLVNSAAVMPRGSLTEMAVDDWDATLALNLRAPWLCARAAARLMAENTAGGCIINLTDSGANKAWTGFPAYIVSKAALESLTRLLARALAPNVRVNAVAPGLILPGEGMPDEQWLKLVDRLPLRAAGDPDDVARAVLFFIQNPYITGQILAVDGGYQLV